MCLHLYGEETRTRTLQQRLRDSPLLATDVWTACRVRYHGPLVVTKQEVQALLDGRLTPLPEITTAGDYVHETTPAPDGGEASSAAVEEDKNPGEKDSAQDTAADERDARTPLGDTNPTGDTSTDKTDHQFSGERLRQCPDQGRVARLVRSSWGCSACYTALFTLRGYRRGGSSPGDTIPAGRRRDSRCGTEAAMADASSMERGLPCSDDEVYCEKSGECRPLRSGDHRTRHLQRMMEYLEHSNRGKILC